jgi:hypothetical protein
MIAYIAKASPHLQAPQDGMLARENNICSKQMMLEMNCFQPYHQPHNAVQLTHVKRWPSRHLRVVRSTANGWPLTLPATRTRALRHSSFTTSALVRPRLPPPCHTQQRVSGQVSHRACRKPATPCPWLAAMP